MNIHRKVTKVISVVFIFLALGCLLLWSNRKWFAAQNLMKTIRSNNYQATRDAAERCKSMGIDINERFPEYAHGNELSGEEIGPLFIAVSENYLDSTHALLDSGAKLNVNYGLGRTPLYICIGNGNFEICKLLLKYGAMTDIHDLYGATPLFYAVQSGNERLVKLFLGKDTILCQHDINNRNIVDYLAPSLNPLLKSQIKKMYIDVCEKKKQ